MIKLTLIFLAVFVTVNCEPPIIAGYKEAEHGVVGVTEQQKTDEGQNGSPGHSGYSVVAVYPGGGGGHLKNVGIFENFKRGMLRGMQNGIFGRGQRPTGKTIVYEMHTHSIVPVLPPQPQNINNATEQNNGHSDSDSDGGHSEHYVVEVPPDNGIAVSPINHIGYTPTTPVGYVPAGIYTGVWRPGPPRGYGKNVGIFENFKRGVLVGMQNGIFGRGGVKGQGRPIYVIPQTVPGQFNATENMNLTEHSANGNSTSQIGNYAATGSSPSYVGYNTVGVTPSYVRNASSHYSAGIWRPVRFGNSIFEDFKRGMEKGMFGGGGAYRVPLPMYSKPYSMEPEPENSNESGDSVGVQSEYSAVGVSPSNDADIPSVGYPSTYIDNTVGVSPNYVGYSAIRGYGKSILENFKRGVIHGMENGIMGLGGIKSQSQTTGNTLPYPVPQNFNGITEEAIASAGENGYRAVGVSPGYSHGIRYAGGFAKNIQEQFKMGVLQGMQKGLLGALLPRPPLQQGYTPGPPRRLPIPSEYDNNPWIPMKSEKVEHM